jgi:transposase
MFVRAKDSAVDQESLEQLLARGASIEKIAKWFGKHPSTVSYWMGKYGLEAPNRGKHAAKGGIERERLEALVQAGMTIAEIAAEVDLSTATVRHWMRRYGLRTMVAERLRAVRLARDHGVVAIELACPVHGEVKFVIEGRGYYRCTRCRSEAVSKHRRRLKEILVAEAGGRCWICGYDRHLGALEFHHLKPEEKRLAISYAE